MLTFDAMAMALAAFLTRRKLYLFRYPVSLPLSVGGQGNKRVLGGAGDVEGLQKAPVVGELHRCAAHGARGGQAEEWVLWPGSDGESLDGGAF